MKNTLVVTSAIGVALSLVTAVPALALNGSVSSASPIAGIGSQCGIRGNFSLIGNQTDQTSGGTAVDNYRIFMAESATSRTPIGSTQVGGVTVGTTFNSNRTVNLRGSNITGTSLAGAGPNARIFYVVENVSGPQNNPVAGSITATFPVTVRQLRQSGSNACVQVANAISPNRPPNTNAGPDQMITATGNAQTVTLDGSGTTEPDGDPNLFYNWTRVSGPNVTLNNATTAMPSFTYTATTDTTFVFQLRANDGLLGGASTDTVTITFDAANNAPVASAGPDQSPTIAAITANSTITLDATGSTDADPNDTLTYSWTQTAGGNVGLSGASTAQPTFTAVPGAQAQTLTFEVTVSDGTVSDTDTVDITIPAQSVGNTAPTANAGPDQSPTLAAIQANSTIMLDASASSDPDPNTTLTYSWTAPAGVTLSSNTAVMPTFTATPTGQAQTLNFSLTVSDGTLSSTDSVRVTIPAQGVAVNNPPVANAGPDSSAVINGARTSASGILNANASSDPDPNTTLTYSWTQTSGPAATLTRPNASTTTFSLAPTQFQQILTFQVTVSDGQLTSTDSVTVTVRGVALPSNQAPVANAGPNQSPTLAAVQANSTITLNGTGSSDPDAGTNLSYNWLQVSGPAVTLSNSRSSTPTFTAVPSGQAQTLVFRLEVSDGQLTDSDRVIVVIPAGTPNAAPLANAGLDRRVQGFNSTTVVTLDGSASSDPDGSPLSYSWRQASGPAVTLSGASTVSPTFTFNPGGSTADQVVTFELTVSDGASSTTDTVTLTLSPNAVPVVNVTPSVSVPDYTPGAPVQLDASNSTDPNGDTLTYSWTQVSGPTVTLVNPNSATPTFTFDPNANAAGASKSFNGAPSRNTSGETVTFVFEVVVSDGTTASAPEQVTVTLTLPPQNVAPVANAGADIGPVDEGSTVQLDASGSSDTDGDALSYSWRQVSGPTVSLSGSSTVSPQFTVPDIASNTNFVFEVSVTDGTDTTTDRVTVLAQPVGSITIVQSVVGSDGGFSYTSNVPALNGTLTTSNGAGQLQASDLRAGVYTVTASDARGQGFALTDLVCSDTDSTVNRSTRTATINLSSGEDVVCTFTSVNAREAAQEAIREAVALRSRLLLSAEPGRQRRIDRLNGTVAANGGSSLAGFQLPGSNSLPFTASAGNGDMAIEASLAAANTAGALKGKLGNRSGQGSFDVWAEAQVSTFELGQADGDFRVLYVGADYVATDSLLIGAMAQYDDFDFEANGAGAAGDVDGDGFMVGPYATVKLGDRVWFDARAAWGSSDNEVNALGAGSDQFDTSRSFYSAGLSGDFDLKGDTQALTTITPQVSVRYLDENQKAYTDRLGVLVTGQSIELGELSFAPRLSHTLLRQSGWTVSPFAQAEGILSFGNAADDVFGSDTRLRFEGGSSFVSPDGARFGISGFADGLGDGGYENYGLRFNIAYTMK